MSPTLLTYLYYLGATLSAAVISMYAIKKIIFITRNHKIYDIPDDTRKIHGAEIPSLGGIGIFIGYLVMAAFFWPRHHFFMPYILTSSVILFFTGIYDDLMNMRPSKKLVAQLIAAFITVYFANIRIDTFYGLFGLQELAYWPSAVLTTLLCTFFINVFNFVDGIDGLAGVLAILYLLLLAMVFAAMGHEAIAGISFALTGAIAGLLYYNMAPAKIYMGDTGSMFLGFTIFIFSILLLHWCNSSEINTISHYIHSPQNAFLLVFAMLFLPVSDAIRVFILRASRGKSPLKADRTHLHYYLLDAGFTHTWSVVIIAGAHILLIVLAYLTQDINPYLNLFGTMLLASAIMFFIYRLREANMKKNNGA